MQKCKNIDCVKIVEGNRFYCSLSCRSYYYNKYLRDYNNNAKGLKEKYKDLWITQSCIFCKTNFKTTINSKKKFCNTSCASSFNNVLRVKKPWSANAKLKQSENTKRNWENENYVQKQLLKPLRFNSKKEIEIRQYLQNNFKNDNWTSGGCLKFKKERLVRDIYSNSLKTCIEYDGDWHFINIKGQLERKQLKDKLLEQWCAENNYRLIRIDEKYKFTYQELISLIYKDKRPLIKLGERYEF